MLSYEKRIGYFGENKTAVYLREMGYALLSSNFHSATGEIDIVAENDEYLCFVEVKTRREGGLFPPSDAVGKEKEKNIRNTAAYYRSFYKTDKKDRFDISEVIITADNDYYLNYIENAF